MPTRQMATPARSQAVGRTQSTSQSQQIVVSDLFNNVFTSPEERQAFDRLYNTFFKIPLYVVEYQRSSDEIPSLIDIAGQFHLPSAEAARALSAIDCSG